MRTDFTGVIALVGLAALAGCGNDTSSPKQRTVSFEVSANQLPAIPAGKGHYEAWIAFPLPTPKTAPGSAREIRHGTLELIDIGTFNVGLGGELLKPNGQPAAWALRLERDVNNAAEAWISIEPETDTDTIPAGLLLAGAVVGTATRGVAQLSIAYHAVLDLEVNADLASFAGTYTLETPSDADSTNEGKGLYFRSANVPGLNLPELDGDKINYEGWIETISTGAFRSTGRFLRADTLDFDGAGYGGGGAIDPFPGQEFLTGVPVTLNDGNHRVLVTLEPADDNDLESPSPFVLFRATIANNQATGVPVAMQNVTGDLPTASVVINR